MKLLLLLFPLLFSVAVAQTVCPAPVCDSAAQPNCNEPTCACAVSQPENVALEDRPQIVYLSFDDAFSALSETNYYSSLFDGTYTNPNGCPIRATHFVTHQSNDYSLNNKYFKMGHEFASHSITHRSNTTYWQTLKTQGWDDEMAGMKTMIERYAGLPPNSVVGMRAPYLQGGGDQQFEMMAANGFEYDCTMPNQQYGYTNMANGIWPYSLDYSNTLNCQIAPCPTCSYPNIWTQPILDLEDMWVGAVDPEHGVPCVMLEGCIIPDRTDPEAVFEMMMMNFDRAHSGNTRAPIGFYMHAAWFYTADWHYEGYKMFLQNITTDPKYNDTWIVPIRDGIAYRKDPVPLSVLWADEFKPFQCEDDSFPAPLLDCTLPTNCAYYNVTLDGVLLNEIRMKVCTNCPDVYPWLGNPNGTTPIP